MANWADVGLALAGAPVGALITVYGVSRTNAANARAQRAALESAQEQNRMQLEHDLLADHQRATLARRRDQYAALLRCIDRIASLFAWAADADDEGPEMSEWTAAYAEVAALNYQVAVDCDNDVRHAVEALHLSLEAFVRSLDREPRPGYWQDLRDRIVDSAAVVRARVMAQAVTDRVQGIAG